MWRDPAARIASVHVQPTRLLSRSIKQTGPTLAPARHPPAPCSHRLALVSRRFRRLCHSGPLLQRLFISLGKANDEGQQFLPRLAALARWLKSAGGSVRQLRLDLRVPADAPGGGTWRAFQALKQSLAAACPNLSELSIQLDATVKASSWLVQLRGLTQLELSSAEGLRLTADLSASRQLEQLRLRGGTSLRVATAAVLPASLTALELAGSRDEELPPQVGRKWGLGLSALGWAGLSWAVCHQGAQLSIHSLQCHHPAAGC